MRPSFMEEKNSNNTEENKQLNKVENLKVFLGDVGQIIALNKTYEITLANINKNILLQDMNAFSDITKAGGHLILSGLLTDQVDEITNLFAVLGWDLIDSYVCQKWALTQFARKSSRTNYI